MALWLTAKSAAVPALTVVVTVAVLLLPLGSASLPVTLTVWNSVPDLPTRTLDVHVSKIRAKLALRPQNGYRLQTIFGYGYRLDKIRVDA